MMRPSPYVYVVEPQMLFVPTVNSAVFAAGGCVVRVADTLDIKEIASLRADFALLDLDYTEQGVADGLAMFRAFAGGVKPIVLTEEPDLLRLAEYRDAGAVAVLTKHMGVNDLTRALRQLFEGEPASAACRMEDREREAPAERRLIAERFGTRITTT
jgi:DNA-binding NarL/FixJ family response regulator